MRVKKGGVRFNSFSIRNLPYPPIKNVKKYYYIYRYNLLILNGLYFFNLLMLYQIMFNFILVVVINANKCATKCKYLTNCSQHTCIYYPHWWHKE